MGRSPPIDADAADALVARTVLPVAAGLSAIFVFFIASDLLLRPPAVGLALLPVDIAALGAFVALALLYWRRPPHASWSQPALALAAAIVLATVFHLFVVEPLPVHTIYLMLVVIAAGSMFISWAWFAASCAASLSAWAFGASIAGSAAGWADFGFGLAAALGLGAMLQASRQRTYARLHALHAQEVDARAKAEASLAQARLNDDRFQLLAAATQDVAWDWDVRERQLWWNDNFYRVLGYPRAPQVSTAGFWTDCVHPHDRRQVTESLQAALEGRADGWSREYRLRRADGSYLRVLDRGRALRDASGATVRMVGSLTDVTAQREAHEATQRQTQLYEKILDALGQAGHAVALVEDGGIAYANERARPLLGVQADGACGPLLATALAALARDGGRHVDLIVGGDDSIELSAYALDRGDARRVLLVARQSPAAPAAPADRASLRRRS